jgi:histidinol-phosphate aminotransferase
VAGPSERLALAALSDPHAARARHEMLVAERARVEAALDRMGWERLPSVTNFILFRPPDADALVHALHRQGVIVRGYGGELVAWVRVTIRSAAENDRFLAAIERVGE